MPARALFQKVASLFRPVRGEGGRQVVRNLAGLLVCTAVSQLCLLGIILLATRHLSLAAASAGAVEVGTGGRLMAVKWVLTLVGQWLVFGLTVHRLRWQLRPATLRLFLASGSRVLVAFLLSQVPLHGGVVLVKLLRTA